MQLLKKKINLQIPYIALTIRVPAAFRSLLSSVWRQGGGSGMPWHTLSQTNPQPTNRKSVGKYPNKTRQTSQQRDPLCTLTQSIIRHEAKYIS